MFVGAVPRDEVPKYALKADILVLVQKEVLYGSSNKLYDYMAAGKPIAISIFADHNNPIHEIECGISAKPDDPESLAIAIIEIAQMTMSERELMDKRARDYVKENIDYKILAKNLDDAIIDIVNLGNRR